MEVGFWVVMDGEAQKEMIRLARIRNGALAAGPGCFLEELGSRDGASPSDAPPTLHGPR